MVGSVDGGSVVDVGSVIVPPVPLASSVGASTWGRSSEPRAIGVVPARRVAASGLDRRAMIFLTDGLPNRVPTPMPGGRQEDTVLAVAAEARAVGEHAA